MLFGKPKQMFQLYEPKRFRTGKLDIFVVSVVFIVFMWAFFIDSFTPMLDENNETIIIETDRGFYTIPRINMQVFIAPLIMVYEMFVLIVFDGKLKGRELPWRLYYLSFKVRVLEKLRENKKK